MAFFSDERTTEEPLDNGPPRSPIATGKRVEFADNRPPRRSRTDSNSPIDHRQTAGRSRSTHDRSHRALAVGDVQAIISAFLIGEQSHARIDSRYRPSRGSTAASSGFQATEDEISTPQDIRDEPEVWPTVTEPLPPSTYQRSFETSVPMLGLESQRPPPRINVYNTRYDYQRRNSAKSNPFYPRRERSRRNRSRSRSPSSFDLDPGGRSSGEDGASSIAAFMAGLNGLHFQGRATSAAGLKGRERPGALHNHVQRSILARPIPNVTSLAIDSAQWVVPTSGRPRVSISASSNGVDLGHSDSPLTWCHIEKPMRGFSDFKDVVSALSALDKLQKSDIVKFLDGIDKMYRGSDGRQLNSRVHVREAKHGNVVLRFAACEHLRVCPLTNQASIENGWYDRPLVQKLSHRVDAARERKQALCAVRDDSCAIFACQTWLLVIGDDHLITSSNIPIREMISERDGNLNITNASRRHALPSLHEQKGPLPRSGTEKSRFLPTIVLIASTRSWQFDLSTCRTWPSLWANIVERLRERVTNSLALEYETFRLDAKEWESLQEQEHDGPIFLKLVEDRAPIRSLRLLHEEIVATTMGSTDDSTGPRNEHLVSHLDESPLLQILCRGNVGGHDQTSALADDLHNALLRFPFIASAYRECSKSSLQAVNERVASRRLQDEPGALLSFDEMIEFVAYAKYIYSFFWTWTIEHEMLSRFWGLVFRLISTDMSAVADIHIVSNNRTMLNAFRSAAATAAAVSETFAHDMRNIPVVSNNLLDAWLYLMAALTLHGASHKLRKGASVCFEKFSEYCVQADQVITSQLRRANLREMERCRADGLYALVLSKAVADPYCGNVDLVDSYRQHLQNLDTYRGSKGSLRNQQDLVLYVTEELEFLKDLADRQSRIFDDSGPEYAYSYSRVKVPAPSDERSGSDPRQRVLRLMSEKSRRVERGWEYLARMASDVREQQQRALAADKTIQETAIYLFTIVTVIFLPLSFLSSVFGMNTSDIRDLDYSQWIFWVTAVPFTAIVVGLCLWFAGGIRLSLGTTSQTLLSPPYEDHLRSGVFGQEYRGDYGYARESRAKQPYMSKFSVKDLAMEMGSDSEA